MGDYSPVNISDATPFTRTASATVTGGQLLTVSGDNTLAPCTTGDRPVAVAAHDAVNGQRLTVWPLPGIVHESTPQGVVAIAAGNDIIAGTTGLINKGTLATDAAAGTLIGICTKAGTGGTSKAQWIGL